MRGLGLLSRYYDGMIDYDGDALDNDGGDFSDDADPLDDEDGDDSDDADHLDDDVSDVFEEGALARSVPGLQPPARVREAALSGLLPGYGQRLLRLHSGRKERASQKKSEKEQTKIRISFFVFKNIN